MSASRRALPRPASTALAVVLAVGLASLVPTGSGQATTTNAGPSSAGLVTSTPQAVRVLTLPVGFRPEGITSAGDTLFTSSLATGQILAVDRSSGQQRTLLAGVAGRSLRGLLIDPRTHLLYAIGQDGTTGILLAVDLIAGQLANRWIVPGAVFLNDLVITPQALWLTDSRVDKLARLPLGPDGRPGAEFTFFPLTAPWPTPNLNISRANGIRALPDGTLLLDHYTSGGLWAFSPQDGTVRAVPVTGGPPIISGDGVVLLGNTVWIVVGTGKHMVTQLRLEGHGAGLSARWVRDLTDPLLDVPSTAVLVGGRLWTPSARFGVVDPATASFWISGVPLGLTS